MLIFPHVGVRRGLGHPFLARFFLFCFLFLFLFLIIFVFRATRRMELCKMPRIAVGAISPLAYVAEVVTRAKVVADRPMASRAKNKLCHL